MLKYYTHMHNRAIISTGDPYLLAKGITGCLIVPDLPQPLLLIVEVPIFTGRHGFYRPIPAHNNSFIHLNYYYGTTHQIPHSSRRQDRQLYQKGRQ